MDIKFCNYLTALKSGDTDYVLTPLRMKKMLFALICMVVFLPVLHSQEFQDEDYDGKTGTMYRARITEDRVNVRDYPSTDGARLGQLNKNDEVEIIGISKDKQTIDSYNGYWLYVYKFGITGRYGWVFSRYVDIKSFEPAKLNVENFSGDTLKVSYLLSGRKVFMDLKLHENTNGLYSFLIFSRINENAHYSIVPGVYMFDPKTKEIIHFTYLGEVNMFYAWVGFTDGYKYLIQYNKGMLGYTYFSVWRMSDKKIILSGDSKEDVKIRSQTIEVTLSENDWNDKGFKDYAADYKKKNPPSNMQESLYIICEINLDTGKTTVKGAKYYFIQ